MMLELYEILPLAILGWLAWSFVGHCWNRLQRHNAEQEAKDVSGHQGERKW